MFIIKEALASSELEGADIELYELLLPEQEVDPHKHEDWRTVQNYIEATCNAVCGLEKAHLSKHLVQDIQKTLANGNKKSTQSIRKNQKINRELTWQNSLDVPNLIKIASSHHLLETSGFLAYPQEGLVPLEIQDSRIGRLLLNLQFIDLKILSLPALFLSDFFKRNKDEYYNILNGSNSDGSFEAWIEFFLSGVKETGGRAKSICEQVLKLKFVYRDKIQKLGKRVKLGEKFISVLLDSPVTNVNQVAKDLNVTFSTANNLIKEFQKLNILSETTGFSRNRFFALEEYLGLFEN